jgi:hypothetical protein
MTAGSESSRPLTFALSEDDDSWEVLRDALSDLPDSPALASVLDLGRAHGATQALLEPAYMDADYRNEFANFYAQTFRSVADSCRRLHFFKAVDGGGDRYLGFCVLRPIRSRPVGRTFIVPPPGLDPYVSCLAIETAHPLGLRLNVPAFPFMTQDTQFGVCAHVSVWMVAMYHHLQHRTPRRLLSDIKQAADSRIEGWRTTPSEGLSDDQVGAALQQLDLPLFRYAVYDPPRGESVLRLVCRYLNSRFPIVLTTREHVTVLIGYGRDTNGRLFFVRADEGYAPYETVYADEDPLGSWDLLMVPLPGRIYMSAETAERFARATFRSFLRRPEHSALRARLPTDSDDYRLRTYAVNAGEYKHKVLERGMPPDVAAAHRLVGTSKWIWVVELQDEVLARTDTRCVLGEIIIDPTSDKRDPNLLFGNLVGRRYTWTEAGQLLDAEASVGEPYKTGTAIHDAPTAPPLQRSPTTLRRWIRRQRAELRQRRRKRARSKRE